MADTKRWNTTVKLQEYHCKEIEKFLEDDSLKYRSRSDFVIKAVEREINLATLKTAFTDPGKIHFDNLIAEHTNKAYQKAIEYDREIKKLLEWEKSIGIKHKNK